MALWQQWESLRSRSPCSWAGLNEIKGLLTYVFDVTIVIMRNMRAQLLTFQNGVYSQDLYYRVITRFYRIIEASGMIIRLLLQNKATRMAKLTSLV